MPFAAALVPILTAASSALGIGTTIYGLTQGGGTPPFLSESQQAAAEAKAKADADAQQKTAAVQAARQYTPNVQAQLGGAVSPDYYAQTAATQTGFGDQLSAVRAALGMQGLAPTTSTNGLSATSAFSTPKPMGGGGGIPDIQTLLSQLQGGGGFHGAS